MKKIEKIIMTIDTDDLSMRYYEGIRKGYEKINELVDAVNEMMNPPSQCGKCGCVPCVCEQTQEPEMCNRCGFIHTKEEGCPKPTLKEPEMNGHWVVDQGGNKFWATDHKKEPECKHEYNSCANNERPFCGKCGRQFGDEKPAKKDELAERLEKAGPKGTVDNITFYKAVADEAQKWAVEIVRKIRYEDFKDSGARWDELERRFKESK